MEVVVAAAQLEEQCGETTALSDADAICTVVGVTVFVAGQDVSAQQRERKALVAVAEEVAAVSMSASPNGGRSCDDAVDAIARVGWRSGSVRRGPRRRRSEPAMD